MGSEITRINNINDLIEAIRNEIKLKSLGKR